MDDVSGAAVATGGAMRAEADLIAGMGVLKRTRAAGSPESTAEILFRRGWAALVAGREPVTVARDIVGA